MPIYLIFIIIMIIISIVAAALWKGQMITKRTALLTGSACALAVLMVTFVLFWGIHFLSEMGGGGQPLHLPNEKAALSVDITSHGRTLKYTEEDWIVDFLYLIRTAEPTNRLSVQDFPAVTDYVTADIHFQEETVTLYLYRDKGAYYVEQPYQGIYRMDTLIYEQINISEHIRKETVEFVREISVTAQEY